jgi:glycosyltransferase involved in cell wall biosynthesis
MKIALISAFPPGTRSLGEYGYHLALALAADPAVTEVVVLADLLTEARAELDLPPGVRVRRVWGFNDPRALPAILSALRQERVAGAIYNLQVASFGDREVPAALGLLAPLASRLMGLRSGIIAHNMIAGVDLEQTNLKGQPMRQMVVRAAGRVITRAMCGATYMTVTLRSYAQVLQTRYPRADVTLVPHGTFDAGAEDWVPQADRPARIVTMGKFGTYKRLETLLAAFDVLRTDPRHHAAQLVIGGTDHPVTPGYMAGVAATRRDDPGVTFAGYIPEDGVGAFFRQGRVCAFDYESTTGSSGVLHQAASHGAVPVFPHIGDFIDVTRDEGLSGVNYAPGDVAGLAAALDAVLSDPAGAETVARANHASAMDMPLSRVAAFHVARLKQGAGPATLSGRIVPPTLQHRP